MKTRYEVLIKQKGFEHLLKGDGIGKKYNTKEEALASISWEKSCIEKIYIRKVDVYELEEVSA